MDISTLLFSDPAPYPPVVVAGPNPQYATAIISNLGSCCSEISAVSLYFYVTVQTAGKLVQKRTLSWLIRPSLHQFSHRIFIRCFLTGFFGQEDEPSELLHFYNSLITRETYSDISQCFHHISIVEMHHLDLFGQITYKLGADPRLWHVRKSRMAYWSPACNRYTPQITPLLLNAIADEEETIRKYRYQADCIQDEGIAAILNRIIKDEEVHIQVFHRLLAALPSPNPACPVNPS